jgi:molybdenum cofactor synthesis domain-containing protein
MMKPFGKLLRRADAMRIIDENMKQIARTESVLLEKATGRVLASDIRAGFNVPPFTRARMDGYAVKAKDTAGASKSKPKKLRLIGVGYAGEPYEGTVDDAECIEIATGSPLPKGADAVVMVEYTKLSGKTVEVMRQARPRDNITPEGKDIKAGEVVVKGGEVLSPAKVGALASLGFSSVQVYAKPHVAIYSTGDEIAPQGQPLRPGQVYDSNSYTLTGIVEANGCVALRRELVPDNRESIIAALKDAAAFDVGIFNGGSSVGSRDLVGGVVEELGVVHFHGLQVKPGKPTLFGIVDGTPIFGMPGYPTSCLSNAYIFLIPALRKLARLPHVELKKVRAKLDKTIERDKEREYFCTVRLEDGKAIPVFKGSSDITSMTQADGLVIVPQGTGKLKSGTRIEVHLLP